MAKDLSDSVGIILDKDKFEPLANGSWMIRDVVDQEPHVVDQEPHVADGPPRKLGCQEGRIKPCSGALVRSADGKRHYLATAGHCNLLDSCLRRNAWFATGLDDLRREIDGAHMFQIGDLRHYEASDDRDIAIFDVTRVDGGAMSSEAGHRLPPDGSKIAEGGSVHIVGHNRAEKLRRIDATILRRIPPEPALSVRAMNLELADGQQALDGLSGSPVFDSQSGELLGVIQGSNPLSDHIVVLLLRRLSAASNDKKVVLALFRDAMSRIGHRDPGDESLFGSGLVAALSRSPRRLALHETSMLFLDTGMASIDPLRLEDCLSEKAMREVSRDLALLEALVRGTANAVFLGSAMSDELY